MAVYPSVTLTAPQDNNQISVEKIEWSMFSGYTSGGTQQFGIQLVINVKNDLGKTYITGPDPSDGGSNYANYIFNIINQFTLDISFNETEGIDWLTNTPPTNYEPSQEKWEDVSTGLSPNWTVYRW